MVLAAAEHQRERLVRAEPRRGRRQPLRVRDATTASAMPSSAAPSRSSATPLASAIRLASSSRPSETSSIAVAPASAATTPSRIGGRGASCSASRPGQTRRSVRDGRRVLLPVANRKPEGRRREPEPARVGDRVAGPRARPEHRRRGRRGCPVTVTERDSTGDRVRSPPTTPTPGARRVARRGHAVRDRLEVPDRRLPGRRERDEQARSAGRPSRRCRRGSSRPPSSRARTGDDHARRKSGPSTIASVLSSTRPSGAARIAASSPGPSSASARASRGMILASAARSPTVARSSVISARPRPTGTAGRSSASPRRSGPTAR